MSDYTAEISDPVTTVAGTFRVRVEYDPDPDGVNPREDFDQLGTMVLSHRRYDLPREGDLTSQIDEAFERGGLTLAMRYLSAVHNAVVLPVYGYDHGQLRLKAGERLGSFSDPWDSGIAGVIYVERSKIAEAWGIEQSDADHMPSDDQVAEGLTAEVEQYDTWANGEMTGYVVEQLCECGECEDEWCDTDESCWGYFSVAEAMEQGREAIPTVRPETDNERVITVSVPTARGGWEVVSRERVSLSSQSVGDVTVNGVRFGGMAGQRVLVELRDGNDHPLHCGKLLTTR